MTTSAGIVPYGTPSHKAIRASPQARVARHVTTLAALISGIVGSKSTQLPNIAPKVPDGTKPESRVKRFDPMARQRAHLGGGVLFYRMPSSY